MFKQSSKLADPWRTGRASPRDQLISQATDDDQHTYDYVIEMLQRLFLFPRAKAFRHAVEVDTTGRTIVLTCELPQAEFARDQIQAYGPDPRLPYSKGSMRAILEPATDRTES